MNSYLTIDGWRANIRFSSAHLIPEYKKCGRLHGHTYAVHAKIFGKPDEKGIILDFSAFKKYLQEIVNELDHMILIPGKSSVVKIEKDKKSMKVTSIEKTYVFPINDCVILPIQSTSAENLSQYILDKIIEKIPKNQQIKRIEIGVDEGFGQGARASKDL